jgi:hypothetical protein
MNWSVLERKTYVHTTELKKTSFKMHVWYHSSLHDFLAYRIFCAWCVHGKFPCSICKEHLMFIWL